MKVTERRWLKSSMWENSRKQKLAESSEMCAVFFFANENEIHHRRELSIDISVRLCVALCALQTDQCQCCDGAHPTMENNKKLLNYRAQLQYNAIWHICAIERTSRKKLKRWENIVCDRTLKNLLRDTVVRCESPSLNVMKQSKKIKVKFFTFFFVDNDNSLWIT